MQNAGTATEVRQVGFFSTLGLWLLSLAARVYFRTLRFSVRPEDMAALCDCSEPTVLVIWHNRILLTPSMRRLFRYHRGVYAAISASRDGALISKFLHFMQIRARRGSSSRRASAVAMELVQSIKEGCDIAITPDGPRGPVYTFHEGAAMLANLSKSPVLLLVPNPKRGWRFNSWDGFYLPAPFTPVEMRCRRFTHAELPRDRAVCAEMLRREMLAMTADLPEPPRCELVRRKAAGNAAAPAAKPEMPPAN
ncbi:MAG TPA: DUF374 domain-containing protein [Opitutales bacterium]|nr:DUF374 domain-containing protein [Opitutales bacterium]